MSLFGRTNSSPNLKTSRAHQGKAAYLRQSPNYYDEELEEESEFFVVGDRVQVDGRRQGSVAYFGETEFGPGDWAGVALDEPTGNHDGKLHGRRYFQCAPNHGLFVRPHRVQRISDSALGSSATSSRCATPLPSTASNISQRFRYNNNNYLNQSNPHSDSGNSTFSNLNTSSLLSPYERSGSRASTGSSLFGSYYYDDDYRQQQVPSAAALARKLNRIEERTRPDANMGATEWQGYAGGGGGRSLSRPPTPVGILKHSSSGGANVNEYSSSMARGNNLSSRVDELNMRLRASSVSPSSRSVFSFRPKREQLDSAGGAYDLNGRKQQRSIDLFGIREPARRGDRVVIRTERDGELTGLLRFMGETNFATGEWAGVELDEPVGKNDGSILGHRYFHCPPSYGLFVPATRVRKYDPERDGALTSQQRRRELSQLYGSQPSIFSSMRSTIKSPPPPRVTSSSLSHQSGSVGSRSTTPSYTMDTLSPVSQPSTNSMSAVTGCYKLEPDWRRSESTSPAAVKTTNLDDFSTKLRASPEPPKRTWSSSYETDSWRSNQRAKFDDHDIELKLKQSLNRSRPLASSYRSSSTASLVNRPKAIEYTFISNKLDGEPIARRTVIYD